MNKQEPRKGLFAFVDDLFYKWIWRTCRTTVGIRCLAIATYLLPGGKIVLCRGLFFSLLFMVSGAFANPNFSLHDMDGKLHELSDYRGKWVVINYWATWCPPCLEELPELVDFHERHKDSDAVVLGINTEQITQNKLRKFIDENFISYPVFQDTAATANVAPVRGLPTTFLVAPDGRLVAKQTGAVTAAGIEEFMQNNK